MTRLPLRFALLSTALAVSACSNSGKLAEASGPVFALNTNIPPGTETVTKSTTTTTSISYSNLPPGTSAPTPPTHSQTAINTAATPQPIGVPVPNPSVTATNAKPQPLVIPAPIHPAHAAPSAAPLTADDLNTRFLATHQTTPGTFTVPSTLSPASITSPSITPALLEQTTKPMPILPPPPPPTWTMAAGSLVGHDIQGWGHTSGWTVIWQCKQDWTVPATTQFQGQFQTVASQAVTALAGEGANIRAKFYAGNHTLIIFTPGAADAQ